MIADFFYLIGVHCFLSYGFKCGPSEYKSVDEECCPMCSEGTVVYHDCTGESSTTCIPCSSETFMSEPNGLYRCFPCEQCAEGLYIKSKCTTKQNNICDVLDGYYCIEYYNSQCRHAEKHSVCAPGQEAKTPGSKISDTVCVNCTHGFYSPSGLSCTEWTNCAAINEIQVEDGSPVKDVKCAQKTRTRYCLIVPFVICAVVVAVSYKRSSTYDVKRHKTSNGETNLASGQTPEENTEEATGET